MTTSEKQQLFLQCTVDLMIYIHKIGLKATYGDAYRDPRVHGRIGQKQSYSHSRSAHKARLALDLNLFKDGKYLTDTEDYREVGEYWKTIDPLCRWGGDFKFKDGNHFSFEHNGMR